MGKKQQGQAFAAANLPSAPLKKTWPPRAEALAAHRRCTHKRGPRKSPMARTRDSLRAGGVLLLFFSKIIPLRGPSPRRRGSVLSETRKNAARRPIPAQAVKIQRNSLAKLRCDHRPSRKDTMIVSRKTPFFWERKGGRQNLRSVALTMPKGAKAPQNSVKKPSATTFSLPNPSGIHAFCASGRHVRKPPFLEGRGFPGHVGTSTSPSAL